MKPTFFPSAAALRRWFAAHHASSAELLIGFYKKASGKPSVTYEEALDEALCVGWIDGVRRPHGPDSYTVRFSPRTAKSIWSQVNIARARALITAGQMKAAGRRAFEKRDEARANRYSYERKTCRFDADLERRFKADAEAWQFFQARPPGYRRMATWFVVSAKKPETRLKRLELLIAQSKQQRVLQP